MRWGQWSGVGGVEWGEVIGVGQVRWSGDRKGSVEWGE